VLSKALHDMNIHLLPIEQTVLVSVPDNTPSDAVLQQQILAAHRAALQAKHVHNYTQAKMSAEAARSDSHTMFSRHMTIYNSRWFLAASDIREQQDEHSVMEGYVQCTAALCKAIESHELGHIAQLAAEAASQDPSEKKTNFQEMATIFRDVLSSQHAQSPYGQLLDPSILSMISGLAVPCADALMLEAIAHYEQYHFHAGIFDLGVYRTVPALRGPARPLPVLDVDWHVLFAEERARYEAHTQNALRFDDNRSDAMHAHHLRIRNISATQKHAHDLAVREWLPSVSHEFTPEELAHFTTLQDARFNSSNSAILSALLRVVGNHAQTHYLAAKQDLELRNIGDCDRNARLAIEAFQLTLQCACAKSPGTRFCLLFATKMHMTKMLLLLNDELRFAQAHEVVAQSAAGMGDPVRAMLHTGKATQHLDRHDVILELVNPMLLEDFEKKVHEIPRAAPDVLRQHLMRGIQSNVGPVSTTVRERVRNENILQEARRNMLVTGAESLRRSLARQLRSDRIYDATEGIAAAVLQ